MSKVIMIEYACNGFKIYYPAGLKRKGDFPYFTLKDPKTPLTSLYIMLRDSIESFAESKRYYESVPPQQTSPNMQDQKDFLRKGEYSIFPGSRELFSKRTYYPTNSTYYNWDLIIPIGNRILDISASTNEEDLAEFNKVWVPIVDSIKLDIAEISKIPDEDLSPSEYNWTKTSKEPKQIKEVYSTDTGFLGLYDSNIEFYDEDGDELEDAINEANEYIKFAKMDKKLLLFACRDGIEIPVNFYLEAQAPELAKWYHVIEGLIGIDSGKLYFGLDDPFVSIKMKKGVYKFRIYFGLYSEIANHDDEEREEYWHIYLWATDEKENNNVKILKQHND